MAKKTSTRNDRNTSFAKLDQGVGLPKAMIHHGFALDIISFAWLSARLVKLLEEVAGQFRSCSLGTKIQGSRLVVS